MPRVSRREALLALGWATAATATTATPALASEPASGGSADARPQPSYRETDHIRRFYDCARF